MADLVTKRVLCLVELAVLLEELAEVRGELVALQRGWGAFWVELLVGPCPTLVAAFSSTLAAYQSVACSLLVT